MTRIRQAKHWLDGVYDRIDPYVRGILAVLLAIAIFLLVVFAWQARDAASAAKSAANAAKITAAKSVTSANRHHAETSHQNQIQIQQQEEILANQATGLALQREVIYLQALAGTQATEIKNLVNAHTGDIQQNSALLVQVQQGIALVNTTGKQIDTVLTSLEARVNAECLAVQKIQPLLQCQPLPPAP